jgi:hypothetical protein
MKTVIYMVRSEGPGNPYVEIQIPHKSIKENYEPELYEIGDDGRRRFQRQQSLGNHRRTRCNTRQN